MEEFDLIDRYFLPLCQPIQAGDLGIGDDGAVMTPPEGHQLVVVTDTLVSGVHFPIDTCAYDIAWKALAVNLSDLAAMGAKPGFYSMGLTIPESDPSWLKSFAGGFRALSRRFDLPLIGGDTTRGPLTVTVTAHGWVEKGTALLRSGANAGDWVCVTGPLGDGGLGLMFALDTLSAEQRSWFDQDQVECSLQALNAPIPQLKAGRVIRGFASSAIDISDGLMADLGHILESSSAKRKTALGAEVWLDALPLSAAMQRWIDKHSDWSLPLAAGDDYHLCFTVHPDAWAKLHKEARENGVELHRIGRITEATGKGEAVTVLDTEGGRAVEHQAQTGYRHF